MKLANLTQKMSLILACAFIFAFGVCAQEQTSKTQTVPRDEKPSAETVRDEKPSEEEAAMTIDCSFCF